MQNQLKKNGFTLIELLVVGAIIGILLALAIPNLLRARISSNEVNARKMLQTLRDSEYSYYEQDLNGDSVRNFTSFIGSLGTQGTLRDPAGLNSEEDALIDSSFENAVSNDGVAANTPDCVNPKSGYCVGWSEDVDTDNVTLTVDFGWEATMTSNNVVGRKDFAVFVDKPIRCTVSTQATGSPGLFEATRSDSACD